MWSKRRRDTNRSFHVGLARLARGVRAIDTLRRLSEPRLPRCDSPLDVADVLFALVTGIGQPRPVTFGCVGARGDSRSPAARDVDLGRGDRKGYGWRGTVKQRGSASRVGSGVHSRRARDVPEYDRHRPIASRLTIWRKDAA